MFAHCCRCLAFFHACSLAAMKASAHSLKLIALAAARAAAAFFSLRTSIRIEPVEEQQPGSAGALPGLLKANSVHWPDAVPALAAAALKAQQKALVVGIDDLQIEPVAVVVPARLLRSFNLLRRQHGNRPVFGTSAATYGLAAGTQRHI